MLLKYQVCHYARYLVQLFVAPKSSICVVRTKYCVPKIAGVQFQRENALKFQVFNLVVRLRKRRWSSN